MEKQKTKTAFVMSIAALVTSLIFWAIIPGILTVIGWETLEEVEDQYRTATKMMLIIVTAWIAIKAASLLPFLLLL